MMSLRVTPAIEEEGAMVEEAKEEGGIVEVAGSSVSTCGRLGRSWASLYWTKPTYVTPMMVKRRERERNRNREVLKDPRDC